MEMKKRLAVIFCLVIIGVIAIPAIAAAPVYNRMSDEELWANYHELTQVMIARGLISQMDLALEVEEAGVRSNYSGGLTNVKWVVNTSTKKIHRPDCKWVDKMAPINREYSDEDISYWLNKGYDPCGICNPR